MIKIEFDSLAIVEVKKLNQEKGKSDMNDIKWFAKEDRTFLKKQIEIIDPHIIICCGTLEAFDIIYDYEYEIHEELFPNIWNVNNKLVIDSVHPSTFPWSVNPNERDIKAYNDLFNLLEHEKVQSHIKKLNQPLSN